MINLTLAIEDAIGIKGNILPPSLNGYGPVEEGSLLSYFYYSGGFCSVYPLRKYNQSEPDKCLRFWDKKNIDMKQVAVISNYIRNITDSGKNYFIEYEYCDKALKLQNGDVIPGLIMDWVDGVTLIEYIKQNYSNASLLQDVSRRFFELVKYMQTKGIAHGDLSAENIMVRKDGSLVLIDYDSFYVPTMASNIRQTIYGTAGYQHPLRMKNLYLSKKLDNFSQQIIYLCLLAFSMNPNLAKESNSYIGDKELLFRGADLLNETSLMSSKGYKAINAINNPKLQLYLQKLRCSINSQLDDVPSIIDIEPINSVRLVPFCINCGYKFKGNDNYCIMCGRKRLQYTNKP